MRKIIITALFLLLSVSSGFAQSAPNWSFGYVPTAAQWNAEWASKQDFLGGTPCIVTGCTMSGPLITAASTTFAAGFNLPSGTAPTSPNNGDMWTTFSGLYVRINGATVQVTPSGGAFAVTGATNTFTAYQIISLNSAALQAAQTGTLLRVGNANGTTSRIEEDCYAAACHFSGIRADGTAASPTTLQSGDEITSINAWGYNGSSFVGPQAALRCYAAQNWTPSALGTYCDIAVTASGATSLTESIRFENDGGITVPSTVTGGDKGAGTINAAGIYVNGTAVTAAGITALTGDVTATGPGSVSATLATVNSNVGSFGSSTAIPSFTVNGKGLITAASTSAVIAPAGTLSGTTLNSTVVTSSLTTVGTIGTGVWQGTGVGLAYGGSNANLTANAGGVVYSTSSALAILNNPNSNGECLLSGTSAPTWGSCSGSTGVASLGNYSADTTLNIAGTGSGPWTGTVTVELNLSNANTWAAAQTFTNSDLKLKGSSTGVTTFTSSNASGTNYTWTIPADSDTFAGLTAAGQVLSGGATVTAYSIGSVSSGTTTISCGNGPLQWMVNTGASTIAVPAADGSCVVEVIGGNGSGALTLSGFSNKSPLGATYSNTATSTATVTFTNSSANIGWTTNGLGLNSPVFFTNSGGALPTNFASGTIYYVSSTGTNTIQVAATPGGSAIVAGSAGSGTQTGTQPTVFDLSVTRTDGVTLGVWAQAQ